MILCQTGNNSHMIAEVLVIVCNKNVGSDFCIAYNFVNLHLFKLFFSHILDIDEHLNMAIIFENEEDLLSENEIEKNQLVYFQ